MCKASQSAKNGDDDDDDSSEEDGDDDDDDDSSEEDEGDDESSEKEDEGANDKNNDDDNDDGDDSDKPSSVAWAKLSKETAGRLCTALCNKDVAKCPRDKCTCRASNKSERVECSVLDEYKSSSRITKYCRKCTKITKNCFKYCNCTSREV